MPFMSTELVNKIKKKYPTGTRIKLIKMDNEKNPPPGTLGTVILIDDAGQIHMQWDNGSTLALGVPYDSFEISK